MNWQGKVVLVTGAGRGIGLAVARALADAGAAISVAAHREASARTAVSALAAQGGDVLPLWGDVGASGVADSWVQATVERFGRLDALVHCAAVFRAAPSLTYGDGLVDEVLRTNLAGSFFAARAAGQALANQGSGEIVLFSSIWGKRAGNGRAVYSASKAGVDALVRALAAEWAGLGVRVYGIAPGWVLTEQLMSRVAAGKLDLARMEARAPGRALVEVDEVVRLCLELAAGAHPMLSGAVLALDGGMSGWLGDV